jgi:glycosyltransferase involved in cell wall biosynthesis
MPEAQGSPSPKVSVIIGTFDCEPFVEDCVRSAMNQTERDIEIIIVDDGSTDRTLGILKQLQSQDRRILIHPLPHSGFPGITRNYGIAQARGPYVAFLDGDDLYHCEKVQKILSAFERCPEADVVIHDLMHFDLWPPEVGTDSYLTKMRFTDLAKAFLTSAQDDTYLSTKDLYRFMSLRFVPFCTDSIAIRKEILLAEPRWFREDLRIGEDGELWLRLAMHRRFAYVHRVLSYYRQRPGSVTGDRVLFLVRTIQIHQENLERGKGVFSKQDVRLYKAKIARLFFDLGYEYVRKHMVSEARKAYRETLKLDFQWNVLLAYLKSFIRS